MLGYVTLGTNDLARAAKFYDALTTELGVGPEQRAHLRQLYLD